MRAECVGKELGSQPADSRPGVCCKPGRFYRWIPPQIGMPRPQPAASVAALPRANTAFTQSWAAAPHPLCVVQGVLERDTEKGMSHPRQQTQHRSLSHQTPPVTPLTRFAPFQLGKQHKGCLTPSKAGPSAEQDETRAAQCTGEAKGKTRAGADQELLETLQRAMEMPFAELLGSTASPAAACPTVCTGCPSPPKHPVSLWSKGHCFRCARVLWQYLYCHGRWFSTFSLALLCSTAKTALLCLARINKRSK